MKANKNTRRNFLKISGASALGLAVAPAQASSNQEPIEKLKVVVVGAHPDDPESMCGGTIIVLTGQGHDVVSAYLTRGEAGIPGKSHEDASKIRTAEAIEACKIMNAKPEFLTQIDGSSEITPARYKEVHDFLKKENPDIVFTHWPIDTHRDHRICSMLIYDAWLYSGKKYALYYCEAMSGMQSQNFNPTNYVDISEVIDKKHAACNVHKSQDVKEWYETSHGRMEIFRGMESGYKFAEAFVLQNQSPDSRLI